MKIKETTAGMYLSAAFPENWWDKKAPKKRITTPAYAHTFNNFYPGQGYNQKRNKFAIALIVAK